MLTRRMSRNTALALSVLGLLLLAGCKNTSARVAVHPNVQNEMAVKAINERCPIPGFRVVDPRIPTATYKGHVIAFCCPQCRERWQHWTVAQKDAFVSRQLVAAK